MCNGKEFEKWKIMKKKNQKRAAVLSHFDDCIWFIVVLWKGNFSHAHQPSWSRFWLWTTRARWEWLNFQFINVSNERERFEYFLVSSSWNGEPINAIYRLKVVSEMCFDISSSMPCQSTAVDRWTAWGKAQVYLRQKKSWAFRAIDNR